ncbi:phage scaffolding protein [Fusobacterium ulcerans]|uniref:phage scaffolding protein n=1 Tax=Fusobacterium ulcerans TaxID=861 RepID=UPI002E78CDA9|nr:phage scaffolding protein [Fusobacterium ulcerans]MEE0139286.1 phage scaffolding protein [Fusobacterium ulcerans]
MKKEELIKLGLDEETAKKVEAASTEELKGYVEKTKYSELETVKNQLEESNKTVNKQLEDLKKNTGDAEALKAEIQKMQDENKNKETEYTNNIKKLKVDNAVELALIGAKAKNTKAVKALLNLENLEIGEDGKVKGLEDQIKNLTKDEGTAFLFEAESKTETPKGTDPAGKSTKKDIKDMTYSEMEAYLAANPGAKIN